jgi:acetamidase/formamidase
VQVEGALLGVGDIHAAQSDGEVLRPPEARADVTLSIDLLRGCCIAGPFVETDEHLDAIGSAENLETALEVAITGMIEFLSRRASLGDDVIAKLLGTYADVRICQLVGPDYTLRVCLDRRSVGGLSLLDTP